MQLPWVMAKDINTRTNFPTISCPSNTCHDLCWVPISTSLPARAMRLRLPTAWSAGVRLNAKPWGLPNQEIPELTQETILEIKHKHKPESRPEE